MVVAKVLVTGAAGFVGRHLVRQLLERGDEVHAVDSLAPLTGAIDPAAGWPFFDPRDDPQFNFTPVDCRQFFQERVDDDFDYAFHLAAIVGGRAVIEANPLAVADDLGIDAAYWQWAARTRPAKSVCFSSSAAYPIGLQRPEHYVLLKEELISFEGDAPTFGVPDLSYGWAKLTHEYLGRLAYQRHGLRSVTYRPFSGYGEDQDLTYPFPSICLRAMQHRGAPELVVWGSGEQMRDFIHIDDCVRGVLLTMDQIDDGSALNLSTGIFTSMKALAAEAAAACGYEPRVVGMSDKPEGVFARGGDTTKQCAFGFSPCIPLKEGINRTLEHLEATSA
ncbi:MAG TPA: NAD-dependent epimerase/dehydratase family protein [Acidimicrobiales bacterium]|nr:NAD-dependent epimerase/dehydratase family protein [Acidimicrobiales bacterium]